MRYSVCLLLAAIVSTTAAPLGELGKLTRFELDGHKAFVLTPADAKAEEQRPWVFYAPTFHSSLPSGRDEGWMIERFLAAGIAIAGVDVGESYGSPAGRAVYNKLHAQLVAEHGFSTKACLLPRSRGGLMLYNWACENPNKVACVAGIYPVCDLRSYPGLKRAAPAYKLDEDGLAAVLSEHNPVDRIAALSKAKVPIYHIHGDVDTLVPLAANSKALIDRHIALGGPGELEVPKGQGHNMWTGFFTSQRLVDFVIANARPAAGGHPKPIAHWKLDGEGDSAKDSAGSHHGRVIGTSSAEGRIGKGRLFDRPSGDHIVVPFSSDFEIPTFTVAAWVKLTREPTFSGILGTRFGIDRTFDMKVNDAKVHGDIGTGERWIDNKVNFYADDTGSNGQGGDLPIDRWFHIVFVIDDAAKQCRLYLDADLKKTIPFEGTPKLMQPGQEMHIGHSSTTEFMDGIIDEVKIWSAALSPGQIAAEYGPL